MNVEPITWSDVLDAANGLLIDMPEANDQYHRGVIALATALILPGDEESPAENLIALALRGCRS
jgi:hypothetical protein